MKSALKIAIGVHGRFHAFELGRALLELGADVRVFTNYPAFIAERFGPVSYTHLTLPTNREV